MTQSIIIVGAGFAGWMTAATLSHYYPKKKITVIDSGINYDDIDITGTTFSLLLTRLGLDESFLDYLSQFAKPNESLTFRDFHKVGSQVTDPEFGYVIDTAKFAEWLKNIYCLQRGVMLIKGDVVDISGTPLGIESLKIKLGDNPLSDPMVITGDLYIDCSGINRTLCNAFGGDLEWVDYQNYLPTNRALSARVRGSRRNGVITALQYGWAWDLPMQGYRSVGYCYDNTLISEEHAKDELCSFLQVFDDELECKDIPMQVGILDKPWYKNMVAIGSSCAFVEHMHSLVLVPDFLRVLVNNLRRERFTQWDRDCFNKSVLKLYEDYANLAIFKYTLSVRNDSQFWWKVTETPYLTMQDNPVSDLHKILESTYIRDKIHD